MASIAEWVKKMSDPLFPFRTLDEGLEIDENSECSSEDSFTELKFSEILDVDPFIGWQHKKYKCEGKKDKNGKLLGKVLVSFDNGGEFKGYVQDGRREGECIVNCPEKDIRMLKASYYNDRPEGFVVLEREDASWREGFCLDGRWDGLVREFDDDREIRFIGRYKNGVPEGNCWLRMKGGGFLFGKVDSDWKLRTENGAYIYPDFSTAYTGSFVDGRMVRGRASVVDAWDVLGNIMKIKAIRWKATLMRRVE